MPGASVQIKLFSVVTNVLLLAMIVLQAFLLKTVVSDYLFFCIFQIIHSPFKIKLSYLIINRNGYCVYKHKGFKMHVSLR
jgi:hypothetical protein